MELQKFNYSFKTQTDYPALHPFVTYNKVIFNQMFLM